MRSLRSCPERPYPIDHRAKDRDLGEKGDREEYLKMIEVWYIWPRILPWGYDGSRMRLNSEVEGISAFPFVKANRGKGGSLRI